MLLRSVGRGGASAGALCRTSETRRMRKLPLRPVVMSAGMGSLASLGMTIGMEIASLGMTGRMGATSI
jgi:hypothetical protein